MGDPRARLGYSGVIGRSQNRRPQARHWYGRRLRIAVKTRSTNLRLSRSTDSPLHFGHTWVRTARFKVRLVVRSTARLPLAIAVTV